MTSKSLFTNNLEEYRSLMYYNPDGVCKLNLDGKIVDSNPAFEEVSGYSNTELLGMHFKSLMVDPSRWEHEQSRVVNAGNQRIAGFECELKSKTAKCFVVLLSIMPIFTEGRLVGQYVINRDITQQISERTYSVKIQNMLAFSQRMASIGSWELYPDRKTTYWTDELFHIYGMENTGYVPFEKYNELIHPDDRDRYWESFKSLSTGVQKDIEFRIIKPNGEIRTLLSRRQKILTDNGEILMIGATQDVTEQKLTQEFLFKSEKLSTIGQMAAGLAHEIRNPLTSLKGFLKLIPQTTDPQRYLQIMEHEINRIETVTNELLTLAKPQVKKFQPTDIEQKVANVLQVLNTHALMKSVEISVEAERNIPLVECEPSQIDQVCLNLLKNAIEAAPIGGKVIVQMAQTNQEKVILRIIDNGPGISQENISRLGEPFYSTKENGTGLGLMISQKIVLEHHGKLEFHSEVHKGTTVSMVLPCRQPRN